MPFSRHVPGLTIGFEKNEGYGHMINFLLCTTASWFSFMAGDVAALPSTPEVIVATDIAASQDLSDEAASGAPETGTAQPEAVAEPEVLAPPETEAGQPMIEARAAAPAAFADVPDQDLFDMAADTLGDIETLEARFLQISPSGNVYEGDLALRRPGQLRFDYDDPSPQLIVATNGLVYVHDSELETTDSYPVRETPLKFLLAKKLDLEAAQLRDVVRMPGSVTIVLAAADTEMQGELALIFADDEDFSLMGWGVREPNGAVTSVELSDVKTGVRLNNRLFRAPDAGGAFLRDR